MKNTKGNKRFRDIDVVSFKGFAATTEARIIHSRGLLAHAIVTMQAMIKTIKEITYSLPIMTEMKLSVRPKIKGNTIGNFDSLDEVG
jgi:hypothetical protein